MKEVTRQREDIFHKNGFNSFHFNMYNIFTLLLSKKHTKGYINYCQLIFQSSQTNIKQHSNFEPKT
jgi:hypothetical protein